MTHDLLWTTLASVALIIGNTALTYMVARRGAVDVFGPYTLAKRLGAGLVPFVTLGLTLGIVNHVAASDDAASRRTLTTVGISSVAMMLGAVSVATFVAGRSVAEAFLGTGGMRLLWAVWFYTVALATVELVFSVHRSRLDQNRANAHRLVCMSILPLAVVVLAPSSWDGERIVFLTSALIIFWNLPQLLRETVSGFASARGRTAAAFRELTAYSLPRMPAVGMVALMMAIGSSIATRAGEALSASFVLAGMSIAVILNTTLSAFGIVLLPRIAAMHAAGKVERIDAMVSRLAYVIWCATMVVVPVFFVVVPQLIAVWMGAEFGDAASTVRMVVLSMPPALLFSMMRSVADGAIKSPVNTHAAGAGAIVCAIGSLVVDPGNPTHLAGAYALGMWVTGVWLGAVLVREFRPRFGLKGYVIPMILGMVGSAATAAMIAITQAVPHHEFIAVTLALVVAAAGLGASAVLAPRNLGLQDAVAGAVRTRFRAR